MSELILTSVIDFAKFLVQEFLVKKLQEIFSDSRQEEPIFKLEIRDAKIIEEIRKILEQQKNPIIFDERNYHIINELKKNNQSMEQFTQRVLSEFKILSKQISEQNPELEFEDDEIIFLPPQHEEDESIDRNELMDWLKRIEKSLDEIVAQKRAKIETRSSSQAEETPEEATSPHSKSEQPDNNDGQSISPVGTENTDVQPSENPDNSESQKILKKLDQYKEYGDSFLQKLKLLDNLKQFSQNQSQKNEILENSQIQDFLKKLKDTANKTVELASSPVKIAIMGEYSSGKTRLIESLIGYGGILPASDIPSTGNVTAIYLTQENDFKTTEFGKFNVEYLSEREVQECLDFMLQEAKKRGTGAALKLPDLPDEVNLNTLNAYTLESYENWCKEVWNKTQNLELRYLLRELVIFIRTCISYGAYLYGENFDIDRTTADKGLKLAAHIPPPNQELKFEDIPSVNMIPVDDKQLSPEVLENSFSLIRRVNINVKVSKEIWELGTTQDTAKFILLDFPGLGSANSGVRDTFVSLRELESVQTILILLNAKTPGNDRANKIVSMLEQQKPKQNLKDQILVGVSRFNQLLEGDEAEGKLDQLIDINGSLTEQTVLQKLDVLKTITNDAKGFTSQAERIVLLDQLMGLRKLAQRSSEVQIGTTEFLATLQNSSLLEVSKGISEKWGRLSERLLKTDSDLYLAKQLDWFALDGGISKLRQLLLDHVAAHGLKQLYEDTHRVVNTLEQQQLLFKDILFKLNILSQESEALQKLRSHLKQMYSVYKEFADDLGKEPLKDFQGVAVRDVVKDEITYQILNWKQWNLLFGRAQNGRIVLSSRRGNEETFIRRRNSADNIPTKSDDFYEQFENTVNQLQVFANRHIEQAIENLLNNLSNKLVTQINYLEGILDQEMLTDIEKKLGSDEADIFYALYQGYEPQKWLKYIMQPAFRDEEKPIKTATAFPLARKEKKHIHGQIFDWATEYSQINTSRSSSNQLLLVQRLRDEIITSISLHLIEYVSQINKKVDWAILNILNDLNPQLLESLKQEKLLRYIVGEKQTLNEKNSIQQILSEIAFTYRPEALN